MLVVGIIFSIVLLVTIIYFAISPKSSRMLRLSAVIALGLISLSLAICGFFIIRGPAADDTVLPLPVFQDTAEQPKKAIPLMDILIIAVMLLALVLVIVKSLKDQKKMPAEAPKAREALDFPDADLEHGSSANDDEDSFDLDDLDIK